MTAIENGRPWLAGGHAQIHPAPPRLRPHGAGRDGVAAAPSRLAAFTIGVPIERRAPSVPVVFVEGMASNRESSTRRRTSEPIIERNSLSFARQRRLPLGSDESYPPCPNIP